MIRSAGKRFIPKRFIDYFDSPHPKQAAVAKALAAAQKPVTTQDLVALSGIKKVTVRKTISDMHTYGFVYISQWLKLYESGYVAAYSIGDNGDKQKPLSRRAMREAQKRKEGNTIPVSSVPAHFRDLAKALVPVRTPDQQRKVNNLYLNWISGGQYEHS